MKIKDLERVIFTPGVCRESLTSDYYDVDNTIVVGETGSGKTTAVRAIVNSILTSNEPDTFGLLYFDVAEKEQCPFCNRNRVIPGMTLMNEFYAMEGSYETNLLKFLHQLIMICDVGWSVPVDVEELPVKEPKLIIVIDSFDRLDDETQDAIIYLCKANRFIRLITSVQSVRGILKHMYLFPNRLALKVSEKDSNALFNCNIAFTQSESFGTGWFYNVDKPYVYRRVSIPYLSPSLLNRNMKVHSGYKGVENIAVTGLRESLNEYEQVENIASLKYTLSPEEIPTYIVASRIHAINCMDDYGLYPLLWELHDELNRNYLTAFGKSIYNVNAVEKAMRNVTDNERINIYENMKKPATKEELYAKLKVALCNEGVAYGRVTRGKTDKNSASIIEFMKESILKNGFPHLPKPEEKSEDEPQFDYSTSTLSERHNTLIVNAAKRCIDSIPDDFDEYPEKYKKKYINYLNGQYGEELVSRLLEERAIRLSKRKERV